MVDYVDANDAYQSAAVEHVFPDDNRANTSHSSIPIAMRSGDAQGVAERWLSESRVARDVARFSLPRSRMDIGTGDVVELNGASYRVDRIEEGEARNIEAIRVEEGIYRKGNRDTPEAGKSGPVQYGEVYTEFLDLPIINPQSNENAFHIAATAKPWPGRVAVYSSNGDYGYDIASEIRQSAIVGTLLSPLKKGAAGTWQRGGFEVEIQSGTLQSLPAIDVLNGGNRIAIRDAGDDWEVLQFADAQLIGPSKYRLSKLLRGQAGTEFVIPEQWNVGSDLVVLNNAIRGIDLPPEQRGLELNYRIGPAQLPYDDEVYSHTVFAANGIGLRPYSPCHFKYKFNANDLHCTWVRRSRVEGDVWQTYEIPLGEAREAYLFRVLNNGVVVREVELSTSEFIYTQNMQIADGVSGAIGIEVAQISERFGTGPFIRRTVNV